MLRSEEGPNIPPATPIDGPPPSTRIPKQKIGGSTRRDDSGSRECKESSPSREVGSYFPPSLPRGFTTLLSSVAPAAAQISPSTHGHGVGDEGEAVKEATDMMQRAPRLMRLIGRKEETDPSRRRRGMYHLSV